MNGVVNLRIPLLDKTGVTGFGHWLLPFGR